MAKELIKGAQAFQFATENGDVLELYGLLLNWSDSVESGIAEHRILQRSGALHQDVGAPPKRWEFHCVIVGKNVNQRWLTIQTALDATPFGQLTHPRLGLRDAVFRGMEAQENPADEIDTIRFTIKFSEDGLRKVTKDSAGALASGANSKAAALVSSSPPALQQPAASIQKTITAFLSTVSVANPSPLDLEASLRSVHSACAAYTSLAGIRGESYHLKAQAALVSAGALASYNAVLAGRPPIIERTVRGTMSLTHLTASLYGGRHSKDMAAEISRLNRIPRPWAIVAGTVLLLPDPMKVRSLPPQL